MMYRRANFFSEIFSRARWSALATTPSTVGICWITAKKQNSVIPVLIQVTYLWRSFTTTKRDGLTATDALKPIGKFLHFTSYGDK